MPSAAAGKPKCPKMWLAQGQLKDAKASRCHCGVGFQNLLWKEKKCFSAEKPNATVKLIAQSTGDASNPQPR